MARQRLLPDIDVLLQWRDVEGLSQSHIAERVNERNRHQLGPDVALVSRSAVSAALQRAGKTGGGRARYFAEIPWSPIAPEHKDQYPHSMLRLWARVNAGETLPQKAQRRLDSFAAKLAAAGEVITYDREQGFIAVQARPQDSGLIRIP